MKPITLNYSEMEEHMKWNLNLYGIILNQLKQT